MGPKINWAVQSDCSCVQIFFNAHLLHRCRKVSYVLLQSFKLTPTSSTTFFQNLTMERPIRFRSLQLIGRQK